MRERNTRATRVPGRSTEPESKKRTGKNQKEPERIEKNGKNRKEPERTGKEGSGARIFSDRRFLDKTKSIFPVPDGTSAESTKIQKTLAHQLDLAGKRFFVQAERTVTAFRKLKNIQRLQEHSGTSKTFMDFKNIQELQKAFRDFEKHSGQPGFIFPDACPPWWALFDAKPARPDFRNPLIFCRRPGSAR